MALKNLVKLEEELEQIAEESNQLDIEMKVIWFYKQIKYIILLYFSFVLYIYMVSASTRVCWAFIQGDGKI